LMLPGGFWLQAGRIFRKQVICTGTKRGWLHRSFDR
jgi:hypothetical protein